MASADTHDAIVVGGGLAGLVATAELAAAGRGHHPDDWVGG